MNENNSIDYDSPMSLPPVPPTDDTEGAQDLPETENKERPLIIEGGKRLEGSIELQGAKNGALPALAAAVLAEGEVIIENVPDIEDIKINVRMLEKFGAIAKWIDQNTLSLDCSNLVPAEMIPEDTTKTTGSKFLVPPLIRRLGKVVSGPPGGDAIGGVDRFHFDRNILRLYSQIGIDHTVTESGSYEFFESGSQNDHLRLANRYFGVTVQTLLAHAMNKDGSDFVLENPSIEPEIMQMITMLQNLGADIDYDPTGKETGNDKIIIKSKENLHGGEFKIASDPNELVSYAVMTLITDGNVKIGGIDYNDKVEAFLKILKDLNADFDYSKETGLLEIKPSMAQLKPIDLATDFWPAGCHTDWQQILTPLLMTIPGQSSIVENVYPKRFTSIDTLKKMGGNCQAIINSDKITRREFINDGQAHEIQISGGAQLNPTNVESTFDIRGTTGIVAAMLSAQGTSRIEGTTQLQRGLGNFRQKLEDLGASIS